MALLPRRPATLVTLALLAIASGCGDSPTAPRPLGPTVLAPGAVSLGTIQSMADTAHFSLVLTEGKDAMIYLMARGDLLRLEVRDSTGRLVTATSDAHNTTAPERRVTAVIPASPYRYHVDVSMVNGTAASDYEIRVVAASYAPEHVPSAMTVGAIVSGEDLEHAYDVDSFTVSVDHDQLVNLYLRKTVHSDAIVTARLFGPYSQYLPGGISAGAADTVLGRSGSGRFTLAAGSHYVIRVYYANPDTAKTAYEMELHPIDPAPEAAPAALVPGDTIHESIDYLGDVDDFTLTGAPGSRYNLFAEADGNAPHGVTAVLAFGSWNDPAITANAGAELAATASGVFTLPASGILQIHVYDSDGWAAGHVGPYRLFAYPIDERPEGTSADLAFDQATTSTIDLPGDIDEFTLTIRTDTAVNVELRRPDEAAGRPLRFTLLTAGDSELTHGILGIPADTAALGTRWLRPGTYKVRVEPTSSVSGGFAGSYEIVAHTVSPAPEHGAGTIALGDTIRGELLDFPGDIDRFHLSLAAGDSVYLRLAGIAPEVGARAYLYRATDGRFIGGTEASGGWDGQSAVITIADAGTYYIEVTGSTAGVAQTEIGPYELAINRITTAPEDRAGTIALGDTVASWIETPGDADDYTLVAPAGTEVTGGFRDSTDTHCCIQLRFIDPATGVVIKQPPYGNEGLGRVTVPAGGALRVRISEPADCAYYGCYSPGLRQRYRFWVVAVNRAPETRPAAFAIGDTVSGEWIDPVGDIDEYSFSATAGDTVDVYFQTPMGTWGYEGLKMSLVDAATGATLGTLTSNNPTANLEDIALSRVVLPSSGSFMIRVEGTNAADNKGVYRFRVGRSR